ncbi:hypothetical protein [Streptomyces sp. NPDC015125]|uniref:hypothetical protein n=1 Tax=Streptomyces sp. NPDC015125 TaxID=3364938 RepID=UPI0037003208
METTGNAQVSSPQLKALFLSEAIRAGTLVREIFIPTAVHADEHLELTPDAVRHAADTCARSLKGNTAVIRLPAAARHPL